MLGWFQIGLKVDQEKANAALVDLVADEELMSLFAHADPNQWDFGRVRIWMAELRAGELTVGRPDY